MLDRDFVRRLTTILFLALASVTSVDAHHPDRENQPVRPRIDVIGPIGNRLPISYRRRYNRPTNIGGKIAYKIAPTSQEAMAWHAATHRGDYKRKAGRVVETYYYAKPYDVLPMGTRKKISAATVD
ncbi:hypothetical protein LF1_13920 [Rubripirellula obstinata]|uniref:Uncharacterized protein n=1 Tax=Rubripirellula obstinata TaxID=406547 RepID=A0A5B1CCG9_9BACT|nr:hypothetical protein [Rubripirellula obstinata]KAA1258868.1 hypothetical protein LF1_13920 [Rubripirellula obstinata]